MLGNESDYKETTIYRDQSVDFNDAYGLGSANLTLETQKYLDKLKGSNTKDHDRHSTPNLVKQISDAKCSKFISSSTKLEQRSELQSRILDVDKIRQLPKLT